MPVEFSLEKRLRPTSFVDGQSSRKKWTLAEASTKAERWRWIPLDSVRIEGAQLRFSIVAVPTAGQTPAGPVDSMFAALSAFVGTRECPAPWAHAEPAECCDLANS